MMQDILVERNRVSQRVPAGNAFQIIETADLYWVHNVSDEVTDHHTYDGRAFSPPATVEVVVDPPESLLKDQIEEEKQRRFALGVEFNGSTYQTDPISVSNLLGLSLIAEHWLRVGGAQNVYTWFPGESSYTYINADNESVPFTAQDMIDLSLKAAAYIRDCIRNARALKDLVEAGDLAVDPTDSKYWP